MTKKNFFSSSPHHSAGKRFLGKMLLCVIAIFAASFTATNAQTYYSGDVAVINAIIENNGLNLPKANPADGSTIPNEWKSDIEGGPIIFWSSETENKRITGLDVGSDYPLTGALDVSGLTALEWLDCRYSQLTSLNVSGLTALESLDCFGSQLTSLNLSGATALTSLSCYDNQLTTLDVSGLTALKELYCYDNQLTSLDVSGLTALYYLDCFGNQLTSLNLSGATALMYLGCYENQLTSLDVPEAAALMSLYCSGNQLTSLDVSRLTALLWFDCSGNQLAALDVSSLTELYWLNCSQNRLTGLVLSSAAPYGYGIDVSYNYMASEAAVTGATITWDDDWFKFNPQHVPGFIAVTNITGVPANAIVGTPLTLSGTVIPSDAANKTIAWSIPYDYDDTGAVISGNTFTATSTGWVQIKAIIANGKAVDEDYVQYFDINVSAAVPVITSANSATFTVGTFGTFTVTASNSPISFAVSGALPSGVTFNASTGVLSGTPATGTKGTYNLTFTATNANGGPKPQSFTEVPNISFSEIKTNGVSEPQNFTLTVNASLGIEEIGSANASVKIYPNPVKEVLRIESGGLKINKLKIIDLSGRIIQQSDGSTNQINVSSLPQGIYFIMIETEKGFVTKKFIKI